MLLSKIKAILTNLLQKIENTIFQIKKNPKMRPTQPLPFDASALSGAEVKAIIDARNLWLQAKESYNYIGLNSPLTDSVILYMEMCQRRYLGLLKEVQQAGRHCTAAQCAWWTLTTRGQAVDYNYRCAGGVL